MPKTNDERLFRLGRRSGLPSDLRPTMVPELDRPAVRLAAIRGYLAGKADDFRLSMKNSGLDSGRAQLLTTRLCAMFDMSGVRDTVRILTESPVDIYGLRIPVAAVIEGLEPNPDPYRENEAPLVRLVRDFCDVEGGEEAIRRMLTERFESILRAKRSAVESAANFGLMVDAELDYATVDSILARVRAYVERNASDDGPTAIVLQGMMQTLTEAFAQPAEQEA